MTDCPSRCGYDHHGDRNRKPCIEVISDAAAEMYRRMSPGERIRVGFEAGLFAIRMAEAGIRYDHADWAEDRVRAEALRRVSGAAR